jgi:coenzyme F420-reducing hydrogenase alpha subunit
MPAKNPVRTIHNCAAEIGHATRGIADNELRKIIAIISEALEKAHKEIEALKTQVNQLSQTTAD